jgi:hypothetical protein
MHADRERARRTFRRSELAQANTRCVDEKRWGERETGARESDRRGDCSPLAAVAVAVADIQTRPEQAKDSSRLTSCRPLYVASAA